MTESNPETKSRGGSSRSLALLRGRHRDQEPRPSLRRNDWCARDTWAITTQNWWLMTLLPFGYGFAWYGHFIVENRPATFTPPVLMADFKMYALAMTDPGGS